MKVQCKYCPQMDMTAYGHNYRPGREKQCDHCGVTIHMHYEPNMGRRSEWYPYDKEGRAHVPLCSGRSKATLQYAEPALDGVNETQVINLIEKQLQPVHQNIKDHISVVNGALKEQREEMAEILVRMDGLNSQREVVIKQPDKPSVMLGRVHKQTEAVIQRVAATFYSTANTVALVGPAGSGKTTIAKDVSRAFDLPFFKVALSPQTTESRVLGFNDANGHWVDTPTFLAYKEEFGAVLLIDEFDAGNSGSNVVFNSLFDQSDFWFGSLMLAKSEKFIPIVTMNTYGYGQDMVYVGRNKLDGATLDRLRPRIFIEYDWQLVFDYSGADEFSRRAINYVANVDKTNTDPLVFGPRAAQGLTLATRAGIDWNEALDENVWCGIPATTRTKIENNLEHRVYV